MSVFKMIYDDGERILNFIETFTIFSLVEINFLIERVYPFIERVNPFIERVYSLIERVYSLIEQVHSFIKRAHPLIEQVHLLIKSFDSYLLSRAMQKQPFDVVL